MGEKDNNVPGTCKELLFPHIMPPCVISWPAMLHIQTDFKDLSQPNELFNPLWPTDH